MKIQYSKHQLFSKDNLWNKIEEVKPDDFDLQMLKEIKENPDCKEFVTEEELKKELGLL